MRFGRVILVAWAVVAAAGCSAQPRSVPPLEDRITDVERAAIDDASDVVLLDCMSAAGFDVSLDEIDDELAPARFDGEAYHLRLHGDGRHSGTPIAGDLERLAEEAERHEFDPDHPCESIAEVVAAIQVLGADRADLALGSAGSSEGGLLTALMADTEYIAADQAWRACLASRGLDASRYRTIDDFDNEIEEIAEYLASRRPEDRDTNDEMSAAAELPVLTAAADDCNPPMISVIHQRKVALAGEP